MRAAFLTLATACTLAKAPALARAQTPGAAPGPAVAAAPPRELTLDEALAMAKRANRSLVAERARLAGARTNIEQAWAALFPTVTAQGKYTRNYKEADLDFGKLLNGILTADGVAIMPAMPGAGGSELNVTILKQNQLDASLNATMPLIAPAAYPALEAVKTGYSSSEANYDASEASLLFNVAQTFYAAAAADEVLVTRRSSIDVDRATLDNAKTRFAAGTVTKVDVDRAELALVRSEQAELEARYGQSQAYRALATLIEASAPFKVRAPESSLAAVNEDLDTALHLRPELRALTFSERSADAQRRAYGWRWAPTLSAFGNAHVGNYIGFTGDYYSWAAGVQLDWTLFDGGTRDAQRHLAAAQAAEAEARAEALSESIRDDLINGRSFLDTKRQAVQAATRAVSLAQETLDLVRSQYEAGTVTQVDLLQAQDNLVAAQEALAQSHFDVAVADLTLRRSAGTFPAR
jgi:outer membrane protein TolC